MERLLTWGLFLRALCGVYLVVFLSVAGQTLGLFGSEGLHPLGEMLAIAREQVPAPYRYLRFPTLFWLSSADWALAGAPYLGAVAACAGIAGLWSRAMIGLCWALHLSLVGASSFMYYQWDFLLLEAGFLALLMPPLQRLPNPGISRAPAALLAFAFVYLQFRLQLSMGAQKFYANPDPHWATLSYIRHWTAWQPLPAALSWYAHNHVPAWAFSAADVFTFIAEVPVPFLFFAVRPLRLFAAACIAAVQVGIALLGNYGIFQLMSLVLLLPLLDDRALGWLLGGGRAARWAGRAGSAVRPAPGSFAGARRIALHVTLGLLIVTGSSYVARMMLPGAQHLGNVADWVLDARQEPRVPRPLLHVLRVLLPFHVSNPYGVFRYHQRFNRGGVIEGAGADGQYRPYVQKYSPREPVSRAPRYFAPHQPRLDHHLFYRGLGRAHWSINVVNHYQGHLDFMPALAVALMEGRPDVLRLFGSNPFPDAPPERVRFVRHDYRFTTPEERARGGDYWVRSAPEQQLSWDLPEARAQLARAHGAALEHFLKMMALEREPPELPPREHRFHPRAALGPLAFWLAAAPGWLAMLLSLPATRRALRRRARR